MNTSTIESIVLLLNSFNFEVCCNSRTCMQNVAAALGYTRGSRACILVLLSISDASIESSYLNFHLYAVQVTAMGNVARLCCVGHDFQRARGTGRSDIGRNIWRVSCSDTVEIEHSAKF